MPPERLQGEASTAGGRSWRPLVVRTVGSVTEALYGLILAASVIAVSRDYEPENAGRVAVNVLVTGIVFWLAHVYARVLATSLAHRRRLSGAEVREALRHDWPLVEVTLPVLGILALGVLGVLSDRVAILVATLVVLGELAAAGGYAARMRGARWLGTVAFAAIAVALGGVVIVLKLLVH